MYVPKSTTNRSQQLSFITCGTTSILLVTVHCRSEWWRRWLSKPQYCVPAYDVLVLVLVPVQAQSVHTQLLGYRTVATFLLERL